MPGTFAHITLVKQMTGHLDGIAGLPTGAKTAYLDYAKYCELGSVSPDYPYLALGDGDALQWADNMHYIRTGEMILSGTRALAAMGPGGTRDKCLAWLLGYAAHVAMDVTIHPIIQLKVGPYAQNKTDHRICEMHQDAYIYLRLNLDEIGLAEPLRAGIAACGAPGDDGALDPDIAGLWRTMLAEVYPGTFAQAPPDIDSWHRGFVSVIDAIEEGQRLLPLARHLGVDSGLTYPAVDNIDDQYISALETPETPMDYDTIFDRAAANVGAVWSWVGRDVLNEDGNLVEDNIGDWNLDTGRDENGDLVFWSVDGP